MPSTTPNLGLTIWNENDFVDFEEINENFVKLDNIPVCTESGIAAADYSLEGGGSFGSASWRYKKYADGTVEASAALNFTTLRCNNGTSMPYYSGTVIVTFPFQFSSVYDVQTHLASNTFAWPVDISNNTVTDSIKLRIACVNKEDDWTQEIYRQVFVSVKGVM